MKKTLLRSDFKMMYRPSVPSGRSRETAERAIFFRKAVSFLGQIGDADTARSILGLRIFKVVLL